MLKEPFLNVATAAWGAAQSWENWQSRGRKQPTDEKESEQIGLQSLALGTFFFIGC